MPELSHPVPLPEPLRCFVASCRWTFARTYAKTWPHEYIVREKVDEQSFLQLVGHIRTHGFEGRFYERAITYFTEDEMLYWTMGAPIDQTIIINRCREDDSYENRKRNGTLPEDRRPPARPVCALPSTAKSQKVRLISPSKAETALLEPFQGLSLKCIHVPKTVETIEQAGRDIVASGVAGFDTESKPTFHAREKSSGPHVVQFALRDRAFVFQLHRPECRALVSELLQSARVLKVGFGLRNDRGQIRSNLGVTLGAILDLDQFFRKRGYKGQIGVRAAVGAVLKQSFRKSKRITTSNWAVPDLTPTQLLYAANDAFAALQVMKALGLTPARNR